PEVETVESMSAHVYGDSAVVIGIYTVKGIDKNKPYNRRGRFTDVWVRQNKTWVCVAPIHPDHPLNDQRFSDVTQCYTTARLCRDRNRIAKLRGLESLNSTLARASYARTA